MIMTHHPYRDRKPKKMSSNPEQSRGKGAEPTTKEGFKAQYWNGSQDGEWRDVEDSPKFASEGEGAQWEIDNQEYFYRTSTRIVPVGLQGTEPKADIHNRIKAAYPTAHFSPFQSGVSVWADTCFGRDVARDKIERNHRFTEEALELVQACHMTSSEAHQLVDYVYSRPIGERHQEVGGIMITLAALCNAQAINLEHAADLEMARVWEKIDKIRAKQAAKPIHSPLPERMPAPIASVGGEETDAKSLHMPTLLACQQRVMEQRCERGTPWDAAVLACNESLSRLGKGERREHEMARVLSLESVPTAAHNEYPEATALPTDERFSFYFDAEGDFVIEAHRQNAGQHLSAHGETPNEAVKAMCRFIEMLPEGRRIVAAPTAAEPVLGESEDCVCGHPVLTHHFTGCRLCGCSRYRTPANDLKTLQSMQAKYAAMMERMEKALVTTTQICEDGDTGASFERVVAAMNESAAVLAAYREMGLGK